MTTNPLSTLAAKQSSGSSVRATVTGLDSKGQIFRESARVIFLKGQQCIYQSPNKPARDSSMMIELLLGPETWRSDARVRAVEPAGIGPGDFRVTIQLDRAHSAVIEADDDAASHASSAAREINLPAPLPSAGLGHRTEPAPAQELAADLVAPPAPAPELGPSVAEMVRSVVVSEIANWKLELQEAIADQVQTALQQTLARIEALQGDVQESVAGQVEAALRQPLARIEAQIEQLLKRPALEEESVRKIAAQAAENAQIEWATASQKIVAEAARAASAADADQIQRELRMLLTAEMDAARRGIDAQVCQAVNAGIEAYLSRRTPADEARRGD